MGFTRLEFTRVQATIGIFLGIALIIATGRTVIRAHTYKSHGFTIDDGFFLLAVASYLAGTVILYLAIPHFYLDQRVAAGLELPSPNFIPHLISGLRLVDAVTSLTGAAIASVKFSFLFFFRALLRKQKKMMTWWWCVFAVIVPTAIIMIFAIFIICAYWNQDVLGL